MKRRGVVVVGVAAVLVVLAGPARAHPLGNFTTNVYAGLRVAANRLTIDYVVDLAEIPAFQARQGIDADRDGRLQPSEEARYRHGRCEALAQGIRVAVDGRVSPIRVVTSSLSFPPGQAGLSTLRLECLLAVDVGWQDEWRIVFADHNFPDRIGWREVTAVGEGASLAASDVPARSLSDRLRSYPADLLQSPLDRRTADLVVRPGGPDRAGTAAAEPVAVRLVGRVDRAMQAFHSLATVERLTPSFFFVALSLALGLGALHALAPGHGKTVMAAYIVGRRGPTWHPLLIGLAVAATHTVGVLALGIFLSLSQVPAAERLYPWLGVASGLLIAAIGLGLLWRIVRRHPHPHRHGAGAGWKSPVALGVAGGLVPSPSALIVLLGAVALGRAWFGVLLVVAFGLGMAATLVGAGLLLLRAGRRLEPRLSAVPDGLTRLMRLLPAGTASLVFLGGLLLAARAVTAG
ncbi:MAG: nickel/cobalt transporter [Acidimicrobiia bacterium]